MLTVADMAEGGVKNGQKSADILYGRPLCGDYKDAKNIQKLLLGEAAQA